MIFKPLLITLLVVAHTTNNAKPGIIDFFLRSETKKVVEKLPATLKDRSDTQKEIEEHLNELLADTDFALKIEQALQDTNKKINEAKQQQKSAPEADQEFLSKEIGILNETYQTLLNIQLSTKERVSLLKQHNDILKQYLKDPEFDNLKIDPHAFYPFATFQSLKKKITTQQERIKRLQEQKNEAQLEFENKNRKLTTITKEYQEKKREQKVFGTDSDTTEKEPTLTFAQQGILIDLEEKYLLYEKELAEQRSLEEQERVAFIDSSIGLAQDQLKILKSDLAKVRNALRIDQKNLQEAKVKLTKAKEASLKAHALYSENITKLTAQKNSISKEFDALQKQYEKHDSNALGVKDWNTVPDSITGYLALCELGYKNEQLELIDAIIDHSRAQIELEKSTLDQEKIKYNVLESWFKITRRKYKNQEEIVKELKKFNRFLTENERNKTVINDKKKNATNLLTLKNKSLSLINTLFNELKNQKNKLFRNAPNKFNFCKMRLGQAHLLVEDQIKTISNLIKDYNKLSTIINNTVDELKSIVSELETKSIWQRSEYAISWRGIKNITNDLRYFVDSFFSLGQSFIKHFTMSSVVSTIKYHFRSTFSWILLFIRLLLIIALFFILRRLIPRFARIFSQKTTPQRWLNRIYQFCGLTLSFLYGHLIGIYCWVVALVLIQTEVISDLFLQVLFYIISILYLCFLTYRYLQYLLVFNREHDYVLFSQHYQKRFHFVLSLIAYFTITLLLFRQAFIIATYHTSELPTILFASFSVIFRILIIFLIGKDEILSLIPQQGAVWNWLSDTVNRYYWPLLAGGVVLLIMSDPYIGGYGNLVSYIFWGLLFTIVMIKLLIFFQNLIRSAARQIFFYTEDEKIKERFSYARTWFGMFVILLFVFLVLIGILIGFRIWGRVFSWEEIKEVFSYELFRIDKESVTPRTLLGIITFIATGFAVAFAVNKFVIRRIFRLIPVDVGIQNTITSLIRYLIIFSAFILGFNWGGLTSLLIAIGLVIGSISYILKEPLGDFISYFVILVQRPIKIGDLIEIDPNTIGIVRQITPRSVIMRSKNSFSIVVPNSVIITNRIKNWNYSGVFVALNDILLTVPFSIDPGKVKEVIASVLEHNTEILKTPRPVIRLQDFGENGYIFMVRAFVSSSKTLDIWDIASDLRFSLVQELRKHDIMIAFPTRVILQPSKTGRQPFEQTDFPEG